MLITKFELVFLFTDFSYSFAILFWFSETVVIETVRYPIKNTEKFGLISVSRQKSDNDIVIEHEGQTTI